MKRLDIDQRSDEWQEFRVGKITGSKAKDYATPRYISKAELLEFAKNKGYDVNARLTVENIRESMSADDVDELDYTVAINDHIYKLIAEQVARPITPNDYTDRLDGRTFSMMARGEILEAEALAAINERLGTKFTPGLVWQSDDNPNIAISPDAELVEGETVHQAVEIKCLDSWRIIKAFYENKFPQEYRPQALQYFVVNPELERLHFCLYSDVFTNPELSLQIFTIHRGDVAGEVEQAQRLEQNVLALVNREVERLLF